MQFNKISIGAILLILIGAAMVGCSNDEEAKTEETKNENASSHGHAH